MMQRLSRPSALVHSASVMAVATGKSAVFQGVRALSGTIPIKGTSRVVQIKVDGEQNAVKAQEVMQRMNQIFKKEVKGFVGTTRFVCKSEWDMFVYFRFMDMDSLKAFLGSDLKTKKIDPLIKEVEQFAVGKKSHVQNFAADDW